MSEGVLQQLLAADHLIRRDPGIGQVEVSVGVGMRSDLHSLFLQLGQLAPADHQVRREHGLAWALALEGAGGRVERAWQAAGGERGGGDIREVGEPVVEGDDDGIARQGTVTGGGVGEA